MGGKDRGEGTVIYTPVMERTAETRIKAILSEDTGPCEQTLPNLDDLFYSKLCHCSETTQCLPERQLIVNYIQQRRLYIIIQFRICYIVSLENNFRLVQHEMS